MFFRKSENKESIDLLSHAIANRPISVTNPPRRRLRRRRSNRSEHASWPARTRRSTRCRRRQAR
jgi:hypothetical protein